MQNYVKKLPNVAKLIQNVAKRLKKLQKMGKSCKLTEWGFGGIILGSAGRFLAGRILWSVVLKEM